MELSLPALIMSFRESLEAFLLIAIILRYLQETPLNSHRNHIYYGVVAGISLSLVLGLFLNGISTSSEQTSIYSKLWESGSSFAALIIVGFFIVWMINHGHDMKSSIESAMNKVSTKVGLFTISLIIISREGAEIALFSFAGKYNFETIILGSLLGLFITYAIYKSIVRVNISLLFKITLGYLILQAGFLWGYSIHELLSALKSLDILATDSAWLTRAFNLSAGILSHKDGIIGLPIHLLLGWYSKPEVSQFLAQYVFTVGMFWYWKKVNDINVSK
jgi:high-affinity iron transporter